MAADSRGHDVEKLKVLIPALSDTLIDLSPRGIIQTSYLFNSAPPDCVEESQRVKHAILWVVEDESEDAELMKELHSSLQKVLDSYKEECKDDKLMAEKLKTVLKVIDSSFVNTLSKEQVCILFEPMCKNKFIPEKKYKEAVATEGCAFETYLKMVASIRPHKPEWPFELMSAFNDLCKTKDIFGLAGEACDPEELKVLIPALSDTLISLSPKGLINNSDFFQSQKDEFAPPDCVEESEIVKHLILWVVEDESEDAELMKELHSSLQKVYCIYTDSTNESDALVAEKLKTILLVVENNFAKSLSKEDVCTVFQTLCDKKFIAEKKYKEAAASGDNACEVYLKMVSSLRPHKPEWPFVLMAAFRDLSGTASVSECAEENQSGGAPQINFPDKTRDKYKEDGEDSLEESVPSISDIIKSSAAGVLTEDVVKMARDQLEPQTLPSELSGECAVQEPDPPAVEEQDMRAEYTPSTSEVSQHSSEDSSGKLLHAAREHLNRAPKLSSKFSELGGANVINNNLKQKLLEHMTDFSDESEEEYEEPNESAKSDLPLRGYQTELAQNALDGRNTIICAPTGSGKTRVAIHIIREHLKEQDERKPKRKVAFMARTVPLVMQQLKSLKNYLPEMYKIESLTGDSEYSGAFHKFVEHFDVFVLTPRILENHVDRLPHKLATFSLLVFDECHHTRKGEAYNTLMLSYLLSKNSREHHLPQIVGLTASIGIEKANYTDKAEKNILEICGNMDAESISIVKQQENLKELERLVPVPTEELISLKERSHESIPLKKILEIIQRLEDGVVHHIKELNDDVLNKLLTKLPSDDKRSQKYGQWVVQMEKAAESIKRKHEQETNLSVRALITIAKHLKAYNVALETHQLVQLRDVMKYLENSFSSFNDRIGNLTNVEKTCYSYFQELVELFHGNKDKENPNLTILKKLIIKNVIGEGEEEREKVSKSKGIVFVQTRALAHALVSWLGRKAGNLGSLGVEVFTGTAATEDEGGMTQRCQEEVIEAFRKGDIRLIVATTVAEEGLDIPDCNLVIKYNHVGNEITTVQTRGRSRKKGGKSYLLAFNNKIMKEYKNQYDANMMKQAVKNVSDMSAAFICKSNEEHQQKIRVDHEIDLMLKKQKKSEHKMTVTFKMVCKKCRKVIVDSEDVKVIEETHHIIAKREFLDKVEKKPYLSPVIVGDMISCGAAHCNGRPEMHASCGNKLGSVMIFRKIPFVVLSVKSFMFELESQERLLSYKSWKDVPFFIKKFRWEADIKSYWLEDKEKDEASSYTSNDNDDSGVGLQRDKHMPKQARYADPAVRGAEDKESSKRTRLYSDEESTHYKGVAVALDEAQNRRDSGVYTSNKTTSDRSSTEAKVTVAGVYTSNKTPSEKSSTAAKVAFAVGQVENREDVCDAQRHVGISDINVTSSHQGGPLMEQFPDLLKPMSVISEDFDIQVVEHDAASESSYGEPLISVATTSSDNKQS